MDKPDQSKCIVCGQDFNGIAIFAGGYSNAEPEYDTYMCNDCWQRRTGFRYVGHNLTKGKDLKKNVQG